MNVSLTSELVKIVQGKVKSGRYGNASEVIREAVRKMDVNEELIYEMKLERLKKALEPGLRQARAGRFAEYSLPALKKKLNAKRKARNSGDK